MKNKKGVMVTVVVFAALVLVFVATVLYYENGITGASVVGVFAVTGDCDGNYSGSGNWNITGQTVCTDDYINVSGNITIFNGGNLTLANTTLNFSGERVNGTNFLNVSQSGSLNVINNSFLTNNESGVFWNFYIYNGTGTIIDNSTIEKAGYDDGNAVVVSPTEGIYVEADCNSRSIITGSTVTGGFMGIVSNGTGCNITHNTLRQSPGIIVVAAGYGNTYHNNTVTHDSSDGFTVAGDNQAVKANTISSGTDSDSVSVTSGDDVLIEDNTIFGDGTSNQRGIAVIDATSLGFALPANVRVAGNTVNGTGDYGIYVEVPHVNLTNNTVQKSQTGIYVQNSFNVSIDDMVAYNNTFNGIDLLNATNITITGVNSSDNGQSALYSEANSTNITVYDSVFSGNYSAEGYYEILIGTGNNLTNISFINTTFNRTDASLGSDDNYLFIYWYLDVNVTGSSGTAIQNAAVNITDADGNYEFSGITGSDGLIARQTLLQETINTTHNTTEDNYTINATKLLYSMASETINLTSSSTVTLEPAASCGTVTESATLADNYSGTAACLVMGADDITLDCGGYTVFYGSSSSGYGIDSIGRSNITIQNCNIFENGSNLNAFGISFNDTNNSFVMDTVVNTSGLGAAGFYLNSSYHNSFINNTFNRTGEISAKAARGFYLIDSHFNNITNNTITTNNSQSIILGILNNNNNILRGNSLTSLSSISIDIQRGINNTIIENTITTGNNGIRLTNYPNGTSITSNRVTSTGGSTGINTDSCFYCTLLHNIVTSEGNGIEISDTSDVGISHNTLINNTVNSTSDGTNGIYITGSHSQLINNTAVGWAGFDVEFGTNITLTGNTGISNNLGTDNAGLYVWSLTNSTFTDNIFIATSGVGVGIWFNGANGNLTFADNTLKAGATWFFTSADDANITLENTRFNSTSGTLLIIQQIDIPASTNVNLTNLNISNDRTFINTTAFSFLNVSQEVILDNITFSYAEIKYDPDGSGNYVDCPTTVCSVISFADSRYRFNTTHPITYIVNLTDNSIAGNLSDITAGGITSINVTVANDKNLSKEYQQNQTITFFDGATALVNLTADLSAAAFNLSLVSINIAENSIIVNLSGQLQSGHKKTVYIADNSFITLCAKDAEITAISEVSSGCTGANETDLTGCIGNSTGFNSSDIMCTDLGATMMVENLTSSALRGTVASSTSDGTSSSGNTVFRSGFIPNRTAESDDHKQEIAEGKIKEEGKQEERAVAAVDADEERPAAVQAQPEESSRDAGYTYIMLAIITVIAISCYMLMRGRYGGRKTVQRKRKAKDR